MHCRLPSAVALADIADLAEIGGAVGVLLGAAGAGVAYTVQQSKAALEQQVAALQADVAAKEAALAAAEAERKVLEARVAALTPLEARNADNAKENLKLVRALEIKVRRHLINVAFGKYISLPLIARCVPVISTLRRC